MVPRGLLEKPHSQELIARARAIEQMRTDLAERTAALREKIEQEFGSDEDFRPEAFGEL
jgi:hypothetical protein